MGKNNKPLLTVLVEEDKLQRFRDFAASHELPMGRVVNMLIDRLLAGDIEILNTSSTDSTHSVSTGIDRESIDKMIRESIEKYSIKHSTGVSIEDVEVLIKTSTQPIEESMSELEEYTQSQIASVREDLKAISGRSVTTESNDESRRASFAKTYPEWVGKEHRTHYDKLANNPELLGDVAEVYATTSGNAKIAAALVPLGFSKKDGTAYDSANISRIKYVLEGLETDTE